MVPPTPTGIADKRAILVEFVKSVDDELDDDDITLVLDMLRDCNKIKVRAFVLSSVGSMVCVM